MIIFILFIGLWLGISIRKSWIILLVLSLIIFVLIFIRFKKKFAFSFLIALILGSGLSFIRFDISSSSYLGVVKERKDNYFIFSNVLEDYYIYSKAHSYEVGDILNISGKKKELSFTTLESSFDFKNYLNDKGVYYEISVYNIENKFTNPIRLNAYLNKFLSYFSNDSASYLKSLLFGESSDGELNDILSSLHLYRLLSTSGLIINFLLTGLVYIVGFMMSDKKAKLVSLGILGFYFIFVLHKFVVRKIIYLFIFRWINEYKLNKKLDSLTIISILGIIFLLTNYHLAYQDSFILSMVISITSIFFFKSFSFLDKYLKRMSFILFIFVFFIPFSGRYYHEISLLSSAVTLIFSPFVILISVIGILCLYFLPLAGVVDFLINILNNIFNFLEPYTLNIYVGELDIGLSILFEAILYISLYYLSIKAPRYYRYCLSSLIVFLLFYFVPINHLYETKMIFINVGQGDATLIIHKNKTVLIDTGGLTYSDVAKNNLIPLFKKERIYHLDYVIITHQDYDHYGGLESLNKNFPINNIYQDDSNFPLKVGDITFYELNDYSNIDSSEENDKSLVINFAYHNKSILLMGDAPKWVEEDIIKKNPKLDVDLLKVGHHGSNTSTSEEFIKTIMPSEAVISCGLNNKYGHPHQDVIDILNKYNVKIYRTDISSSIYYYL